MDAVGAHVSSVGRASACNLVSSEDAFDDHEKHTRSIGLLLSRPLVGCILYQTIETEHMEKWEAMGECDAK